MTVTAQPAAPAAKAPRASSPFRDRLVRAGVLTPLRRKTLLLDVALAIGVMCTIGLPLRVSETLEISFSWILVPAWACFFLALCVRRLMPWLALALALAGFLAKILLGAPPEGMDVAMLLIWFTCASGGSRLLMWTSGVAALVTPALMAAHLALFKYHDFVLGVLTGEGSFSVRSFMLYFGIAVAVLGLTSLVFWLFGVVQRVQVHARDADHDVEVAQLEQQRVSDQLAVEQQRNQIARDMHDVVAHSLAVVVAQADGGRYVMKVDPVAAEEVLRTIAETSRDALVDVRRLLGQLRHSQTSLAPKRLSDIPQVLDRVRAAGLPVDMFEWGDPAPIGATGEVAVFRLVQEALTNALKYGDHGVAAEVRFEWQGELRILIRNRVSDGPPIARGSGNGIMGMRERLAMVSGTVEAWCEGDVFHVQARVPFLRDQRRAIHPGVPAGAAGEATATTVNGEALPGTAEPPAPEFPSAESSPS